MSKELLKALKTLESMELKTCKVSVHDQIINTLDLIASQLRDIGGIDDAAYYIEDAIEIISKRMNSTPDPAR